MPHPKEGYRAKDGKKVPSVTEVLKYKDPGPLMWWAWNEGREGRNFRETSTKAATAGTLGHSMVEAWAQGKSPDNVIGPDEELKLARVGFQSFLRWADTTKLKIVAQEVSLVSELYRFAGCLDTTLVLEIDGKLALGDWKFSKGVYGEYLVQIAAYGLLWNENNPDRQIEGGYHLIRFSETRCDFAHRYWEELKDGEEAFLCLLRYHQLRKEIDPRVK